MLFKNIFYKLILFCVLVFAFALVLTAKIFFSYSPVTQLIYYIYGTFHTSGERYIMDGWLDGWHQGFTTYFYKSQKV